MKVNVFVWLKFRARCGLVKLVYFAVLFRGPRILLVVGLFF